MPATSSEMRRASSVIWQMDELRASWVKVNRGSWGKAKFARSPDLIERSS